MLEVGVGCGTLLALVEAEDPARSIKLPSSPAACCLLDAINHCYATAAGEGTSVLEMFRQIAVLSGYMAAVRRGFCCSGETTAPGYPCCRHFGQMSLQ